MASTDATPIPVKNQAYRVTFPILDADGDLVTGATGLDSEVSKDGGTFTDCSSEATEIATSSGMYYLDLTGTEMNADTVAIIVKTTSSGAKTTPMILYPNKSLGLAVNVTAWAGTATTTGDIALKTTLAKTTHITGFNDISTANVQTELGTYGALKPTTAGRTLDVSTGGEAGLDWANVGSPTTTVALSGTTVGTATNLTNDPPGVTTLLSRISSTIFSGITSLKEWLGLIAGKQTGNSTARTELRSTGAGSGTYDETADSAEAIRDRGDAAWITGAGGDPWSTALPGSYGAGTAGNILGSRLDAAVTTRLAPTVAARTLDVSSTGEAGVDWANIGAPTTTQNLSGTTISTTQAVASVSGAVGSVTGAVGSVTAGVALTSGERTTLAGVVWSTLTSALTTASSIGKLLVDNVNATISSRSTYAGGDTAGTTTLLSRVPTTAASQTSVDTIDDFLDTEIAAIKTSTDNLATAMELDGAVYRFSTNALEQAPAGGGGGTTDWTSAEREQIRHRLGIDGTASAPSANPSLPDAGDITTINGKLDSIGSYVDTEVGAIKAKTDQLTFTVANKVDASTVVSAADLNAIADALLKRDWNSVSGEAAYSALNALRMLRNVWDSSTGTLHVKKEDGTTDAWSRVLTTDPAAQPITGAS